MSSSEPVSRLHLVVPVLNESANLDRLIASFREIVRQLSGRRSVRFIMVDDGSTDGTADRVLELAGGLDFTVLRHRVNRGPGAAFGTAFEYLKDRIGSEDWVVTIEGDNTSRQDILAGMLARASEGYDVVLASPYMYGGGILQTTPFRVFLSHMANAFVKEMLGIHGIQTMSSFYRLYRAATVSRLQQVYGPRILERRGFESMIELLLKLIYLRASISEVPMVLDASRRAGRSKMKIVPTIVGYLTLWKDKGRWQRAAIS